MTVCSQNDDFIIKKLSQPSGLFPEPGPIAPHISKISELEQQLADVTAAAAGKQAEIDALREGSARVRGVKLMSFVLKTRNVEFDTRNCVFKTRNSVLEMMNSAGDGLSGEEVQAGAPIFTQNQQISTENHHLST